MHQVMARQLWEFVRLPTNIIGNFVDEQALEKQRQMHVLDTNDPIRIVFLGTLSSRKKPDLLIEALSTIDYSSYQLDVIGDGPMLYDLISLVKERGMEDKVHFHGFLSDPLEILSNADLFVLPSLSEGISRASLEALYLGVPCILRDVDGNRSLLTNSHSGLVFKTDSELRDCIIKISRNLRFRKAKKSLLPSQFRSAFVLEQYCQILGLNHE